jgi:hypothetical protein
MVVCSRVFGTWLYPVTLWDSLVIFTEFAAGIQPDMIRKMTRNAAGCLQHKQLRGSSLS